MDGIILFFLFLFGVAIGSFLNVVTLRYVEGGRLFARVGGRSHCMHCGKTLQWYELIPLFSFLLQAGKCRACKARLTLQYPIVELIAGLIFVFAPFSLVERFHASFPVYGFAALWVIVLLTLLVMSIIDFRLQIIPDGLTLFLAGIGLGSATYHLFSGVPFGEPVSRSAIFGTFLGSYAMVFGFTSSVILNVAIGCAFGLLFLGGLFVMTRGRGIGFGDVKLATALGLLLGWPDIAPALIFAFIFGAIASIPLMLFRGKGMKTAIPFGPFIALGVAVIFFFGYDIVNGYFTLFGLV